MTGQNYKRGKHAALCAKNNNFKLLRRRQISHHVQTPGPANTLYVSMRNQTKTRNDTDDLKRRRRDETQVEAMHYTGYGKS